VETVRRGLERLVVGRTITAVEVRHPRSIRRHVAGAVDFAGQLTGRRLLFARRRGKYLWLPLGEGDALLAHLGMSGQLLVCPADRPEGPHLRVRMHLDVPGRELRFVDQRTFGGLHVVPLPDPAGVPGPVGHIARDPLDPAFDDAAFVVATRRRSTVIKRALLDQTLISGVGNIYADEALWRARLHWARPTRSLPAARLRDLLDALRAVFADALAAGGTSFDRLYVDVEGSGGFFEPALAVYGRAGLPCLRCGTPIRRVPFMNRSAFFCPRCQPAPRRAALAVSGRSAGG
jgi:formamidopyrimidine-DNA glycosylase